MYNNLNQLLGINENDTLHVLKSAVCQLENTTKTTSNLICDALAYLGILIIIMVVIVALYRFLFYGRLKDLFSEKTDRWMLTVMFVISWSLGFVVYCVGGYVEGFGFLSVVFMSMIHATEMFVGSSDISAVHEAQHSNPFYMFMFGLSHFLALLCSLMFIIRQLGFFFIAKLKALWISLFGFVVDDVYVFWGVNDASLLLAENIVDEYGGKRKEGKTYRLVFVRTFDDSERESDGFNPVNLYNRVRTRKEILSRLRHLNCIVVSCVQRISMQSVMGDEEILTTKLGLASLQRIIKNKSRHTHIFMIGDDEDANIKAAINMTSDYTIKRRYIDIYCHSQKSAKTRSLEYYGLTHLDENTQIHIIDTAQLSVSQLKKDVKFHPVQHVEVNNDATIDTPFNSLIVGLGETGLEALRFLYEFGAFIGSDKNKSKFHCTIMDQDMDKKIGLFRAQTPFLQANTEISMYGCSINSSEYWEVIKQNLLHDLNYIVICSGNDDLSLETASNLCQMAIRCRTKESPKKLTICIRSYEQDNVLRLQNFCSDVNDKYKTYGIDVSLFGEMKQIFTYDHIINNSLLKRAMHYNYNYAGSPESKSEKDVWFETLGYKHTDTYSIDEIEEIERKRDQNFSNALHSATKLYVADACCTRENIPEDIRENIARMEHERWMAYMHINGWQRLSEPIVNEDGSIKTRLTTQKLHTDLCAWEEIRRWDKDEQKEVQSYDYKVLDTSLELAKTNR